MAASYNKVLLMGNLTRDPEMRVTPGGLSICKFGLAVNRNFTTKDGEQREETTFVDIDAFGKQAETIAKYMSKGRPLFVEGRLRLDQWEDKNSGEKRSRLGIVLEGFQFIGSKGDGDSSSDSGGGGGYEQSSPPPRTTSGKENAQSSGMDDDIPF